VLYVRVNRAHLPENLKRLFNGKKSSVYDCTVEDVE